MSDFIPLRCPSCGGSIQVENFMEKAFCTHCGTSLILKQSANGLLTPIMAREITASARLKETETSVMMINLLKTQIKDLEEKSMNIRQALLGSVFRISNDSGNFRKVINEYGKNVMGRDIFEPFPWTHNDWDKYFKEQISKTYPGLETPEDLYKFAKWLTQTQYSKEKIKLALLKIIQPIEHIWPELKAKKQAVNQTMEGLLNE